MTCPNPDPDVGKIVAMLKAMQFSRVVLTGYCETCADMERTCPLCHEWSWDGHGGDHEGGCPIGAILASPETVTVDAARSALSSVEFKSCPLDMAEHDDVDEEERELGCFDCGRPRDDGHADGCEVAEMLR